MPAVRNDSTAKDKRTRAPVPVLCPICERRVNRKADLTRHMELHKGDEGKMPCTHKDCTYATRQKSNLRTHMRTHTGEKRYTCKDDPGNCEYRTSDPAAFTRHRKKKHGYVPQARSRKGSVATNVALPGSPQTTSTTTTSTSGTSTGTDTPAVKRSANGIKEEEDSEGMSERMLGRRRSDEETVPEDYYHPSPATSDSEDDSDSSSSSSEPPRSRDSSLAESSDSEVDDFIAHTIDTLPHPAGRRKRGFSQAIPPTNLASPTVTSSRTVLSPPRHPPVSFERRGGPP